MSKLGDTFKILADHHVPRGAVLAAGAVASEPSVEIGELVTVEGVPVLETGVEYPASTGPFTPTSEMLNEVVESQDDPHIPAPRIKIAHVENPINADIQALFEQAGMEAEDSAAEPAIGTLQNLRLSDDGQTLIADWTGLPAWFAEIMSSAYPARSIEGGSWKNEANGKSYAFTLTAVSLLGTCWPGCTSLKDLQELFSEDGPPGLQIVKMEGGRPMAVEAQTNIADVRRAFYEDFAQGDRYWWWDRELLINPDEFIVEDPDEGTLFRVPFNLITKKGDKPDEIEFGEPEPIKIKYVTDPDRAETEAAVRLVSAQVADAGTVLAVNSNPPRERERDNVNKEVSVEIPIPTLRTALGLSEDQLPDDATEEQVTEALAAQETERTTETVEETRTEETTEETTETPDNGDGGDEDTEDEETSNVDRVPVEAAALEQLQRDAEMGRQARQQQLDAERDAIISAAIAAGKIPPARKPHYVTAWSTDPTGTRTLLTAEPSKGGLASGLVPVTPLGETPADDGDDQTAYPAHWVPEVAARAERSRSRVSMEV